MDTITSFSTSLDQLNTFTLEELKELATQHALKLDFEIPKTILIRDIAWQLQVTEKLQLTKRGQRLLNETIKQSQLFKCEEIQRPSKTKRVSIASRLKTGMVLERIWQDQKHLVTVLNDGQSFQYKDNTYKSLSKVAKAITGSHWSGPRFFGLVKLKPHSHAS